MENIRQELEKYIYSIIEEYKPKLFLDKFDIELKFDEKADGMSCSFSYPYTDVTISYSRYTLKRFDAKELDKIKYYVVHELCHLLTDPFYSKAADRYISKDTMEDERELLTDTIAQIILKNKL